MGKTVSELDGCRYTWEEGPNTFQPAPHIFRLAVDLGLKDEIVLADSTLPRFVYWNGELFALPLGPQDIPKFRLLSPWGFIRAGIGAIGLVAPNWSGKEESVKEFISRHLGVEVFQKMIDPFVSGVYAGDPSKLSMSSAFKKIFALEGLGITPGLIEGGIIRLQQRKKEAPPPDPELPTYKGKSIHRRARLSSTRTLHPACGGCTCRRTRALPLCIFTLCLFSTPFCFHGVRLFPHSSVCVYFTCWLFLGWTWGSVFL